MLLLGAVFAAAVAVLPAAQAATTCGSTPAANEQYVGSTNVDSTSASGTSFALPASGNYRVVACGTWHNLPHGYVDAAYNSGDSSSWAAPQQGWPTIAPTWGELTVNGSTP